MSRKAYTEEERDRIRRSMLERSARVFSEKGLRDTSLEDVYVPEGISKTFFYTFFPSKTALIKEVFSVQSADILEVLRRNVWDYGAMNGLRVTLEDALGGRWYIATVDDQEYIRGLLSDEAYVNTHYLVFCTKQGIIKKTSLEAYSRPRQNGVNAITIREDDQVIQVRLTDGTCDIVMANRNGRAIRFPESKVRPMGRVATGVRGMTLDEDGTDEVVGMICVPKDSKDTVMVVSQKGYGKRTWLDEMDENGERVLDEQGEPIAVYRITNRGGKGVKTMNITEKTGKLVAIKSVNDGNDLMIINKSGVTIRLKVADIRVMGRATQGVRLINLDKRNDEIASVCKVLSETEEEIAEGEPAENTEPQEGQPDVTPDTPAEE